MDFKRRTGTFGLLLGALIAPAHADTSLVDRDITFEAYVETLKSQAIEEAFALIQSIKPLKMSPSSTGP